MRSYYTLRYLCQKHEVTLVAFSRPDDTPEALDHLRELCEAIYTLPMPRSRLRDGVALLASLIEGTPFVIRRDDIPEMRALVERLLSEQHFDAVHADQLWMAQYALWTKTSITKTQRHQEKPVLVLDEHNACFQIFRRLAKGERNPLKRLILEREWRALKRYEARTITQFDHVVTVTEEDREILQGIREESYPRITPISRNWRNSRIKKGAFSTIPICVDTVNVRPVEGKAGSGNILHLGTMFWLPNVEGVVWFARRAWPLVRAAIPEATFTIAGKNPPAEIQALARDPSIRVTGYVPDPQPQLQEAGVFIVPLLSGGGMRVKIVDAWRWGLPVVSTPIGAKGLRFIDGEHLLLAETPAEFAAAVVRVLREPDLNRKLRRQGRAWVEEQYDWQRVYPAWDDIYPKVAQEVSVDSADNAQEEA